MGTKRGKLSASRLKQIIQEELKAVLDLKEADIKPELSGQGHAVDTSANQCTVRGKEVAAPQHVWETKQNFDGTYGEGAGLHYMQKYCNYRRQHKKTDVEAQQLAHRETVNYYEK